MAPATAASRHRVAADPVERWAPPRDWDEEFARIEEPSAPARERRAGAAATPGRPKALQLPLALTAVALAGVLLGMAAWLLVLRPTTAAPRAATGSPAAVGPAPARRATARHHRPKAMKSAAQVPENEGP
jgi:hypothetical protein